MQGEPKVRRPDPTARFRRGCGWLAVALFLCMAPQAATAQTTDPNWPCVQRKVPSLSPASMWQGLDEGALAADWRAKPEVAALVARIAPRRVTVEEAQEAVRSFAADLRERKQETLTLLFLGLFQALDAERSEVMRGIERFAQRQTQMAKRILADRASLEGMRRGTEANPNEVTERSEQLRAAIRVFEDRRSSLSYVCDVPRVIEQRLFAISRAIQAELR